MAEIIFQDSRRQLAMQRRGVFDQPFVELLERTVWGSGGLRYKIKGMAAILNRLREPHFLTLLEGDEPVGALTLSKKTVRLEGSEVPAFYSYGLAVAPPKRGKGYGTLLAEQGLRYGLGKLGERGIYYGYVEAGNLRSLKTLQKVGRKSLGHYQSLLVSRLKPKERGPVDRLPEKDRDQVVRLLYQEYQRHSLLDFAYAVKPEDYYILRQGQEIVAGVQVERNHLAIEYLPGAGGLVLIKALPYLPILRRYLPEGNFQYLALGNIYVKPGHEPELFRLMESLLAREQLYFGMIYLDKRSPIYQRLMSSGNFGLFNALVDIPVQVMAFLKGFTEPETAAIRRKPLFISMLDPV